MAAGRPVVATAVDGTPEAVDDGVSGRLAAPRDVEGLSRAVCEILGSPELARRMGEAGRTWVEQNRDYRVLTSRLVEYYERSVVGAAGHR